MEPVDCGAVDQPGEPSGSGSENVSDWREAQSDMEILFDFTYEVLPAVVRGVSSSKWLDFRSDVVDDGHSIVFSVKLGNFSGGQKVIDVNQEPFLGDVAVGYEEQNSFVFHSGLIVKL